ncbi:hypothetical protein HAX54_003992 [Datura stramonium]|uniref:Galectin n=1 Tax=Datura stramonium TaxID=4076 RepID=A0ABS8WWF5_DATST|nr:hypothetical protein [Datura stramonium]
MPNFSNNIESCRCDQSSQSKVRRCVQIPVLMVLHAFLEGNPFTATLWVGIEGFHMSVNGRHEASLHIEKLEPWLVSGVNVIGGVDIISILAKLPVSMSWTWVMMLSTSSLHQL